MSKFNQLYEIIDGKSLPTPKPAPKLNLVPHPVSKPQPVLCPHCGFTIFDGDAIRSRCVKPIQAVAKCRCKQWVDVPIVFSQNSQNTP